MGAAAASSGAPCVPTVTPGPWDIPPATGRLDLFSRAERRLERWRRDQRTRGEGADKRPACNGIVLIV